ncbi:hypothetical protein RBQ61_01790 [Sedimentibacter sp. MB35-C1]|uniref:hypothetical protein n=1 Tax=Sedimentibacter sp. MB35-C1 TaxID=3070995 RepID=UPI0027E1B6DF|nr:hypothetical protein [Sedimentibacter sp. MB35-C1]WMJ77682.1 hypothetical protein RBQ61_01790 [Sedimentibacter sp. MB35-C1]
MAVILQRYYFENNNLKTKIIETENKYQDLKIKKINENFSKATITEMSLIRETFNWMFSEDVNSIILENYTGKTINLKEKSLLNEQILEGMYLENNLIMPKNIIAIKIHNSNRFYYKLKYNFKDTSNEIFIFDDGTIKYNENYYESPLLLSISQSLMPITENVEKNTNGALQMMFNSSLATNLSSETGKLKEVMLFNLWDNAVRLRASAHFINKNMVKTKDIIFETSDMNVLKSTGYCEGKSVDMYIYTKNGGELDHIKLKYYDTEEVYKLKEELKTDQKILHFNNIWTAD